LSFAERGRTASDDTVYSPANLGSAGGWTLRGRTRASVWMSASGSGAEGRNRANGGVRSVAERRATESQSEALDVCRSLLGRPGRAGAEWSALATAGRGEW